MGEKRYARRVLVGKPVGQDHLEELKAEGSEILRWIFK
jgi:hypothetical protein